MRVTPKALDHLPLVVRSGAVGAMYAGLAGCVTGLVLGLSAYPPTAWFAVFEVGIPSALAGALIGCALGAVLWIAEYLKD